MVHSLSSSQLLGVHEGPATQPGQVPPLRVVPAGQEAQALVDVHEAQLAGHAQLHKQPPGLQHLRPSEHVTFVCTQRPVQGLLQVSVVQTLLSLQFFGVKMQP